MRYSILIELSLCFFANLSGLYSAHASEKILLSPHSGDATILEISGINSDRAIVKFRRELDDEIEDCTRGGGDDKNSKSIAACAVEGMKQQGGHIYTRRAFCSRFTLYMEFGNYSMVDHVAESVSEYDGKPYRPMRSDWKDHRTRSIVGNCSACNTPQMLNTLQVLCPLYYGNIFKGYDPY